MEWTYGNRIKENGLNNGKSWGSSVDKGFAQAKCTCRHEHVKDLVVINFDDFVSAYQKCREEFAEDYIQTFTKYLQIHLNERGKIKGLIIIWKEDLALKEQKLSAMIFNTEFIR